jgi:aminoglycoside/choline kinase family phosphotransferase
MESRLTIVLSEEEREALQSIAQHELRAMRDQVRLIVRRDLERRGLLLPGQDAEAVGVNDDHAQ